MKGLLSILPILILSGSSPMVQDIQHEAIAVNIEIPVRVFKNEKFIDNLTIKDFEIYENGDRQNIDAVYLIKKTSIEKAETGKIGDSEKQEFMPHASSRQFVLIFELIDYSPDLKELIDNFFGDVLMPDDRLIIVTPVTTYHMKKESMNFKPKDRIARELHDRLKKDIFTGNREYKSIMRDIIRGEAREIDYLRLKNLRRLEEKKLLSFAETLKSINGQKNVFFLYQKDSVPVPKTHMPGYLSSPIDNLGLDETFDVDKVKQAFSDSSISAHFLYLSRPAQHLADGSRMGSSDMAMTDWSMGVFSAFHEVAKATGGIVDSSASPASSFKKAVDASENYYLLYYTPKNYIADGKFKSIKVKVISGKFRVTHRAGYFAN